MRAIIKHPLPMKIATYNVNSIRRRLPIVLDWIAHHKPDVMCLQETKVQDHEFPADAIRDAGYHASFRGMKAYNGVATLTRTLPEKIVYGLHEGADNEDFRIIQTVVSGVPIINSYVPQGYAIASEKYALKLAWFRRLRTYFETALNPDQPAIWVGDLNVAPEQSMSTILKNASTIPISTSTPATPTRRPSRGDSSMSSASFTAM